MGRSVDQDVHAAFIEFRAKDDDKVSLSELRPCHLADLASSACRCNASIVIRLAQRTPVDKSSTSLNVQAIQTTMQMPSERKPVPVMLSPPPMAILHPMLRVKALCQARRVP
jgi:hypothetical protein